MNSEPARARICSSSTPREGRKEREVIKESTYRNAGVKSWRSAPVSTKSDTHIDDEQAQLEIVQRLFVRLRNALVGCFRLARSGPWRTGTAGMHLPYYEWGRATFMHDHSRAVLGCHSAARTARRAASRRSPRDWGRWQCGRRDNFDERGVPLSASNQPLSFHDTLDTQVMSSWHSRVMTCSELANPVHYPQRAV